jgi:hypothetical protein
MKTWHLPALGLAAKLLLACSPAGDAPPLTERARPDTLLALELGMTMREAASAWDSARRSADCLDRGEDRPAHPGVHFRSCQEPAGASWDGTVVLGFDAGALVYISHYLDGLWRSVPAQHLIDGQEAFGAPAVRSEADEFFGVWITDSTYRSVRCEELRAAADACTITVGYGGLENFRAPGD